MSSASGSSSVGSGNAGIAKSSTIDDFFLAFNVIVAGWLGRRVGEGFGRAHRLCGSSLSLANFLSTLRHSNCNNCNGNCNNCIKAENGCRTAVYCCILASYLPSCSSWRRGRPLRVPLSLLPFPGSRALAHPVNFAIKKSKDGDLIKRPTRASNQTKHSSSLWKPPRAHEGEYAWGYCLLHS